MDIWNKVTLYLLIWELLVMSALSVVILKQPQGHLDVSFGSNLTLECLFANLTNTSRLRVNWIFLPTPSKSSCIEMTSSPKEKGNIVTTDTSSVLTLGDVGPEDSGWYYCKITEEIPVLKQNCSNGTQVTINVCNSTTYSPVTSSSPSNGSVPLGWKVLAAVGGLSAVLAILVVTFWVSLQRKRRMRRESPIYTNMPPPAKKQPSPRPGIQMDNHKMSALEELSKDYDNKFIRSPNPPQVLNCRELRIPTSSQARGKKWSPKT